MKGLKKNLIYWGYTFEKLAVALLAGIAVYTVMMCLMEGGINIEDFSRFLLGYLWIFAFIGIFMNGFTAALSYFPMSISLGTSRKASFWAMQIMQHLIMLQYLVIGAVAYYLFDKELFFNMGKMVLSILGLFLALMTLTNITCICSAKFGKIAGLVVYIVSLILIVATVVIVLLSGQGELDGFEEVIRSIVMKPYLFVGALLADVITIGLYYLVAKKQDLKI